MVKKYKDKPRYRVITEYELFLKKQYIEMLKVIVKKTNNAVNARTDKNRNGNSRK